MTEIIPHIGYHLFPTRMIRWGWAFEDFLGWLPLHPSIKVAPIEEMRAYWRGRELTRAWYPLIEALAPEVTIPAEYVVSAYPGRKRRYTYIVSYDLRDKEGNLLRPGQTTVQADILLTREQVLTTAYGNIEPAATLSDFTIENMRIEYIEDVEFGR